MESKMVNLQNNNKDAIIDEGVYSVLHESKFDTLSINRAVERSVNDEKFLNDSIKSLEGLKFPAFKDEILGYIRKATRDPDVMSLFESLNGYTKFEDQHHVQRALEVNDPEKKMDQSTD
jgi:hypothetical protein